MSYEKMPEKLPQKPPFKFEPASQIPANTDLPNEGSTDPEPERGKQGSFRRRFISAVKGIFGT